MTGIYQTRLTSTGATAIVATGRLTFPDHWTFRDQLIDLVSTGAKNLVVDLSEVTKFDSSTFGALVTGLKEARNAGGDLRLAAPSQAMVGAIRLMGLSEVLVAYPSCEAAFPEPL